jgi:hypothetical protein
MAIPAGLLAGQQFSTSGKCAPWLAAREGSKGESPPWSHTDQEIGGEGEERDPDFCGERGKGETRSGFPLPVDIRPASGIAPMIAELDRERGKT